MSAIALVVAAGRGARFGGETPKQYLRLGAKPVLRHSLEVFARHPKIDRVRVVYNPDDRDLYDEAVAGLDLLPPVAGGSARQDSVRLGLESLEEFAPDNVLIHDAARPFLRTSMIDDVIAFLADWPGAIPTVPVRDTVKRASSLKMVRETLDRTLLFRAQTPQGFRYRDILAAHRDAEGLDLPDDAAAAERAGMRVRLIEGFEENLKVTTMADLREAERRLIMGLGDLRTGQGFDAHAFGAGDHVVLGGVKIPHDQGLVGHSDADVGLHALTDAILGALGAGDIGMHFPPSDPKWRGASSDQFLRHAVKLVRDREGSISHVDLTLICERPKIGPHRDAMVARIAEILDLDQGRVSVKATTTDKLGFVGRGEGIAAQAIATIRLPFP
ncbi:MAG: bifunctional 2-C-methyl-D-erythritol 4-phosphate cytidylyltransferase/2-C-methyl-D-erythritol 2,4-cyclodiphosphate synthase [Stellaceae bacterium]